MHDPLQVTKVPRTHPKISKTAQKAGQKVGFGMASRKLFLHAVEHVADHKRLDESHYQ